MEASRKHGPFDTRWPGVRKDGSGPEPTVSPRAEEVAQALDWDAFSARHFGERLRHDSEARSAYAAYKQGREWRAGTSLNPAGLRLVPSEPISAAVEMGLEEAGTRRLLAAVAAMNQPQDDFPPKQT